jgi:hypothetical protein
MSTLLHTPSQARSVWVVVWVVGSGDNYLAINICMWWLWNSKPCMWRVLEVRCKTNDSAMERWVSFPIILTKDTGLWSHNNFKSNLLYIDMRLLWVGNWETEKWFNLVYSHLFITSFYTCMVITWRGTTGCNCLVEGFRWIDFIHIEFLQYFLDINRLVYENARRKVLQL